MHAEALRHAVLLVHLRHDSIGVPSERGPEASRAPSGQTVRNTLKRGNERLPCGQNDVVECLPRFVLEDCRPSGRASVSPVGGTRPRCHAHQRKQVPIYAFALASTDQHGRRRRLFDDVGGRYRDLV